MISVVLPVYQEQDNLRQLHARLSAVADSMPSERFEFIFVDDCSKDASPQILDELCSADLRVRMIRFARNCGSHAAISAGLRYCRGDSAIVMAADLQDPPELIQRLVDTRAETGARVVWAARARREGEPLNVRLFSRIYWWVMNRSTDLTFAPRGVDVCLLDRPVIDAFLQSPEKHGSIFMLIAWLGFAQAQVEYIKEARGGGHSGWTVRKKVKLFLDSLFSYSSIPIRLMTVIGLVTSIAGFILAIDAVLEGLSGRSVPGWASLALIVLVLGGVQMVMLGILGEYIWRTFDESRRRPFYVIERARGLGAEPGRIGPAREDHDRPAALRR